jgi:hypothetical protein
MTTPSGKAIARLLLRTVRQMGMPQQTETSTARSPICCAQNISASTAVGILDHWSRTGKLREALG